MEQAASEITQRRLLTSHLQAKIPSKDQCFHEPCIISNTIVIGKVGSLNFKKSGKQILKPGWKYIYNEDINKKEIDNSSNINITNFKQGEKGTHKPIMHKGKTSPPKHYTEATLLRAMETAGKQVKDEEMRELMKENGIGRPSTRSNIIETLLKREYILKKNKKIIATENGTKLIDAIQNKILKSAQLTGEWEKKLRLIEKGKYNIKLFKEELYKMVRELTDEVIFNNSYNNFK